MPCPLTSTLSCSSPQRVARAASYGWGWTLSRTQASCHAHAVSWSTAGLTVWSGRDTRSREAVSAPAQDEAAAGSGCRSRLQGVQGRPGHMNSSRYMHLYACTYRQKGLCKTRRTYRCAKDAAQQKCWDRPAIPTAWTCTAELEQDHVAPWIPENIATNASSVVHVGAKVVALLCCTLPTAG